MSLMEKKAEAFGLMAAASVTVALGGIAHAGITSASRSVGGYGTDTPPTGSWSDVTSLSGGGYFEAYSPNAFQESDINPGDHFGPQVTIGNMWADSQEWGDFDEQVWYGTTWLSISFTLNRQYDLILNIHGLYGPADISLTGTGIPDTHFNNDGFWVINLEPGNYSFGVWMDANLFGPSGLSDLSLTIPTPATGVLLFGALLAARRSRS